MILRLGLLLILLAFFVGCDEDNSANGDNYEFTITENLAWSAAGIDTLKIINISGTISVQPASSDSIFIEITKFCESFSLENAELYIDSLVILDNLNNSLLSVEADFPDNDTERDYEADFEIMVPQDTYLVLGNVAGGIIVEDHQTGMVVTNVTGTIDCDVSLLNAGEAVNLSLITGGVMLSVPSDVSTTFDLSVVTGTATLTGFPGAVYINNTATDKTGSIGSGDASVVLSTVTGNVEMQPR